MEFVLEMEDTAYVRELCNRAEGNRAVQKSVKMSECLHA